MTKSPSRSLYATMHLWLLLIHATAWWVLLALPVVLAHHMPLAALAAPLMPLALVWVAIDQVASFGGQAFIVITAAGVLFAPAAWIGLWRHPDSSNWRALAHIGIVIWGVAAIFGYGITL